MLFHFIFLTWFFDCDVKRDVIYGNYRWSSCIVIQLFSYCLLTNHIKPREIQHGEKKKTLRRFAGHEEVGGLKAGEDAWFTTEWLFHKGQKEVPRGESDAMQSWFLRLLALPEERAVLFPGAASRGYSCFL